jgi:hypothetical protein
VGLLRLNHAAGEERTLNLSLTLLTPTLTLTLTLSLKLQEKTYMENEYSAWCAGVKHGTAPFASLTDERDIEQRLELFMSEALIPLAEQTKALVLVCHTGPEPRPQPARHSAPCYSRV